MMPEAKYRAQWRTTLLIVAFMLSGAVTWPHSRPAALACFYAGLALSVALTWRAFRDDHAEPVDWPNDVPRSHVRRIDEEAA